MSDHKKYAAGNAVHKSKGSKGKSGCAAEGVDPKLFALQLGETPKVDRKKFEVGEGSTMRRDTELFNNVATISKNNCAQQLTVSSLKLKNSKSCSCHSIDVSRSEFEHFPMFDINRKIEAIMTSNKKYAYGKIMKESLSLHEKEMMPYEGFLPDNTDVIGEAASRFFQINGKLLRGRRIDTDSNSRYFGSSWPNIKGGSNHMLRESSPSYYPYPLTDRHDAEEKDDSSNRIFLGQKRHRKPDASDVHPRKCKIPLHSIHDVNVPEPCQSFKPAGRDEHFDTCLRKQTIGEYTFSQVKDTVFSERRIIPFGQKHGKKVIRTEPLGNFTIDEVRHKQDGTGAHLIGARNESSTRTDKIYNHSLYRASILGETFSISQEDVALSNLRTESESASPTKQAACRNSETAIAKRQVEHPSSTDGPTYASHNGLGTSRTESMSLDHNCSLAMITNKASGSEKCSRWVKRLQENHSKTLSLCTKTFKESDAFSSECYNPKSISSKTVMPCSGYSVKPLELWMRRWSHYCHEISPSVARPREPIVFQEECLKELPEKFKEKLLGSIGAMALMGKAMSDYRPCEFRRKKAALVWNS